MSQKHDEATRQPTRARKTTPPIIEGYVPKELRPIPPVGFKGHGGNGMEGFEAVFGVSVREAEVMVPYRVDQSSNSSYPPTSFYPPMGNGQQVVDPWAYPTTFPPPPIDARPRAFPVPPPTYHPQQIMGQQQYLHPNSYTSQLGLYQQPSFHQVQAYQPLSQASSLAYPHSASLPGQTIHSTIVPSHSSNSTMLPPPKSTNKLPPHPTFTTTKKSKIPTPIIIPSQSQPPPNQYYPNTLSTPTPHSSLSTAHQSYIGYHEPLTSYPITPLESVFPNTTPIYPYLDMYGGSKFSAEAILQGQSYQEQIMGYNFNNQGLAGGSWSDLGIVPDLVPSSGGTINSSMSLQVADTGKSLVVNPIPQLTSSYLGSFDPLSNPLHRPLTTITTGISPSERVEPKSKLERPLTTSALKSTKSTTSVIEPVKGKTRRTSVVSPGVSNVVVPSDRYRCDDCEETFTRPSDAARHKARKHVPYEQWEFSCGLCNERFSRKDHLILHAKRTRCQNTQLALAIAEAAENRRTSLTSSSTTSESDENMSGVENDGIGLVLKSTNHIIQ